MVKESRSNEIRVGKILPELPFLWRGRRYGFILRLIRFDKLISAIKVPLTVIF